MVTGGGVQIKSLSIIFALAVNRPRLFSPYSSQSIFMRSGHSTKDCHDSYFSEFLLVKTWLFSQLIFSFFLFLISDKLTSVYRGSCQDQIVVLGIRAFDQLVKNSWTCSYRGKYLSCYCCHFVGGSGIGKCSQKLGIIPQKSLKQISKMSSTTKKIWQEKYICLTVLHWIEKLLKKNHQNFGSRSLTYPKI